jgi:hypothetical protein
VVAGYADTDTIVPGTVYSDESTMVQASDTITISSDSFTDIPGLTISLNLARPSAVLQLAQIDFQREYFQEISFRPLCDGQAKNGISRVLRFSTSWQNVFLVALSHPVRVRGLKPHVCFKAKEERESHPVRVRGLKP